MYNKSLTFEGIDVVLAPNGREGVEKAKTEQPDLILCDIMMPEMNGLEVLDRLKADPNIESIPVVMLTNLSGTQDAENAKSKGALAYMVKSEFKPKEIAVKVKAFISGSTPKQASQQT